MTRLILHPRRSPMLSLMHCIDVREIPPRERHPLIFATHAALAPGDAFELLVDHDPKPLYYTFKAERDGQFTWDYLEQGPDIWRVRVGRPAHA